MQDFIGHIKQLTTVTTALEQCLSEKAAFELVQRGNYLHEAGKVCTRTYWIRKGLFRCFYLKDGKEITEVFAAEGEWITSARSFMKGEPDNYFIQAIEDSEVYSLTGPDLMFLFENFHEMERFGRISMSIFYLQLSDRLESYQFTTAREKYEHFCRVYKPVLHRLPLGMIATYLGISQETLSRIRKPDSLF